MKQVEESIKKSRPSSRKSGYVAKLPPKQTSESDEDADFNS